MDSKFEIIIFVVWLIQAIFLYLTWLYWVQVKEYRFDRFKVLLFSRESKHLLLFPDRFRRPVFTKRIQNIILTTLVLLVSIIPLMLRFPFFIFLWLILSEIVLVISIPLGVIWTSYLVNKAKKEDIRLAKDKLDQIKPLVIGVTGSYGKSTTKEFLSQLLSQKYKTFKTPENKNTEFGVARAIKDSMENNTEVFVAEMGAYKIGEIKAITNIISPKIGIITGIEPQHLATFGSLQNIMKAKFELIEGLTKGGIAVFNYSNPYCREMSHWVKKPGITVYSYKLSNDQNLRIKTDMESRIVSADTNGVKFEIKFGEDKKAFSAPVTGIHFVENLTGAILVARINNVPWSLIQKAVANINVPSNTMTISKTKKGAIVVNNSYNSTPRAFEAALNYISLFKGYNKIVVTPGIIELGEMSEKIHRDLSKRIRELKIDEIVLTNKEFVNEFGPKTKVLEKETDFRNFIHSLPNKSVILLEGRIPESHKRIITNL